MHFVSTVVTLTQSITILPVQPPKAPVKSDSHLPSFSESIFRDHTLRKLELPLSLRACGAVLGRPRWRAHDLEVSKLRNALKWTHLCQMQVARFIPAAEFGAPEGSKSGTGTPYQYMIRPPFEIASSWALRSASYKLKLCEPLFRLERKTTQYHSRSVDSGRWILDQLKACG